MAIGLRLLFVAGLLAVGSEAANILGVFTSNSPSHNIVNMAYVRALVERGHNLTIVTTLPIKEKNLPITHIYVPPSAEAQEGIEQIKRNLKNPGGALKYIKNISKVFRAFGRASREAVLDPRVQELIHNPDYKFDLMLLGYFMNDYELGIAAHMKCPIIISWPAGANMLVERYVGNPPEIAYVPTSPFLPPGDPLTFFGRVRNFLLFCATKLFMLFIDTQMASSYKELFPAPEYPPLEEIGKRVSLVFANSHFSEGTVRPSVPALVDVGGIQVKDKPNPLPENLKAAFEGASEHGVVYVSFGSNLGSQHIDGDLIQKIYEALSTLKQTVVWKWDGEKLGNAPNIHFEKWLPQDDLLAHPNMRLFITHAGKGSVAESQYHGVPMVAVPMFAEQPLNAKKLVSQGFGLQVDYLTVTADELRSTVLEVLQNPKYKENVKRFSTLYKDRPMSAKETAVYWIEYVIRHKGAYHMQSPLVHLNGLQYLSLDVIAALLVAVYLSVRLLCLSVKVIFRLIRGRLCSKKQKIKKH